MATAANDVELHRAPEPEGGALQTAKDLFSGAAGGITQVLVGQPFDIVKVRLQTSTAHTSALEAATAIYRNEGPLAFYKGTLTPLAVTLLREAQAYGMWFLSFEYMMNADAARNAVARKDIPSWKVALYGGLAGEALWLGSYPFDVVKSKMQTDGFGPAQRYATMRDCFAQTYRAEGLRGFWKGIAPTLLRAMPVSAATFATVELTMRLIN
ncbi:putative MFS-type transporter [Verticillium dahliae VDG2]|nr:putative MFS-type transporter [Verticillium dahliae VDG2]